MKYKSVLFFGCGLVACLVLGGILLYGQNPPTIAAPIATPGLVVVNTPTQVTFTVDLSGTPSAIPTGVNLLRLNSAGVQTIVATMGDNGKAGDVKAGDKVFTAVLTLNEAQPASFNFQVSAAFPGQLKRVLSPVLQFAALAPTTIPVVLPPDPGVAGKATIAGIDSDGDGVRDDVQRLIIFSAPDSARHREALKEQAVAIQHALLSQTDQQATDAGVAEIDSIECLDYLGKRNQGIWRQVLAQMLNTTDRIKAHDTAAARTNGQVFTLLPDNIQNTACSFNMDTLSN